MKTSFDIQTAIEEMALLVILSQKKEKISIKKLNKNFPNWFDVIKKLHKKLEVETQIENGYLELQTSISFTLYQSIPSEFVIPVKNLVYQIIPEPKIFKPHEIELKIFVPKNMPSSISYPCINCADAPCMEYSSQYGVFGSEDEFASRVCPDDLISIDSEQHISINSAKCTGCTLCMIRCPFNSILPKNGVVSLQKFSKKDIGKIVDEKTLKLNEKRKKTEEIINKYKVKSSSSLFNTDLCKILDNFDTKMLQENWNMEQYYPWVRNVLRELGLEAKYTGSPGKKKVADVTVVSPFFVGIEVKSPAESDVDIGAIRQAVDAKSETASTFEQKYEEVLCAAIGQGIGKGAHRKATQIFSQTKVKIPIIVGRVLLYILLKHQTNLPQESKDLKFLFENYSGEIGINELKHYFEKFFKTHSKYEEYKEETFKEIEKCFKSKKQKARGYYSK